MRGGQAGGRSGQVYLDRPAEPVNELDDDMTGNDMIAILQQLHFATGFTTIQIDRDVLARCGKA